VAKPGVPVLISPQRDINVEREIKEHALRVLGCDARVILTSDVCSIEANEGEYASDAGGITHAFEVDGKALGLKRKSVRYDGIQCSGPYSPHHIDNVATAVVAATYLTAPDSARKNTAFGSKPVKMSDAGMVTSAVAETVMPGRFQVMMPSPAEASSPSTLIVLDGAHTSSSVRALTERLLNLAAATNADGINRRKEIIFVLAMAKDKDPKAFVAELARAKPSLVVCTTVMLKGKSGAFHSADSLRSIVLAHGISAASASSVGDAVDLAMAQATQCEGKSGILCVTGSFSTVAAYLEQRQRDAIHC